MRFLPIALLAFVLIACVDDRLPLGAGEAAVERPLLARVTVHVERDLRPRGCNVWTAKGLDVHCRWAALQTCQALGFGATAGVVDLPLVSPDGVTWWEPFPVATIACLHAGVVQYREFAYDGNCTLARREAAHCEHLARVSCLSEGHAGTVGVVGFNAGGIATHCLRRDTRLTVVERTVQIADVAASDTRTFWQGQCNFDRALLGNGCAHHTDRLCPGAASAGTDVLELSPEGAATFACLTGDNQVQFESPMRPVPIGIYEGALQLGDNVMGGAGYWGRDEPSPIGGQVWADGLYNPLTVPVLVRRIRSETTFLGPGFSRDQCFGLRVASVEQDPITGDGEIECTYSQEATDPGFDLGDRGLVLYPGERLTYTGVAQWLAPDPTNLFARSTLTVTGMAPGVMPVRRLRFPRRDAAYRLTGGAPVTLPAGCVTPTCATPPIGTDRNNTNWYVRLRSATRLGGLSWFISSPEEAGRKLATSCVQLRDDDQGRPGALRQEICHTFDARRLGPSMFPGGNSFVRYDVPVPAGTWVGAVLTMQAPEQPTSATTYMDLAVYAWFDDANRDIGREP